MTCNQNQEMGKGLFFVCLFVCFFFMYFYATIKSFFLLVLFMALSRETVNYVSVMFSLPGYE